MRAVMLFKSGILLMYTAVIVPVQVTATAEATVAATATVTEKANIYFQSLGGASPQRCVAGITMRADAYF